MYAAGNYCDSDNSTAPPGGVIDECGTVEIDEESLASRHNEAFFV